MNRRKLKSAHERLRHRRSRARRLAMEQLENRSLLTINGYLLFESFSAEQGPSTAKLYATEETFGQQAVTCLEINNSCDTSGSDPAWSPDGSKILFIGASGGLYIVDTLGTHLRPVQDANGSPVYGLTPTWVGPTGSGISFAGATSDSGVTSYDILYAPITLLDDHAEIGALKNLTPHIAGDFSPSWNPEGTSVVFDSNREGGGIFRIDNALTDNPTLTNLSADHPPGEFKPDWSGDGTKIVYFAATPVNDIWVMDADGTNAHNVTNDPTSDDAPQWSPDGTKIIYSSSYLGDDPEIYTINADGTGLHQVTDNDVFDWNPDWQPLPEANLNIDIRDVADPVAEGDIAEYTVKVKNGGPQTATNIRVITEPLPVEVDFQGTINPDSCSLGLDRRVTCTMGDAVAGASLVTSLKLRLNKPGQFTLTGRVYTDVHDPVPLNDTISETTTVARSADVGISISASADPVTTIESLTYTLSVSNAGPSAAFDVVVTNTLPADLDFVSVTSTLCNRDGRVVTCNFDVIDALKTLQIKMIVAKKSTDTLIDVADVEVRGSIDNFDFNDHAMKDTPVISPVDTDGDSLFDVWETKGIDANLDGVIDLDLPSMGASPFHKDMFVEVDYMNCLVGGCVKELDVSTKPSKEALLDVITAFANAPVHNPDNEDGIDVHFLLDEAMRMGKDTNFTKRGPSDHDDFDDYKTGSNASANPGIPCGNRLWDGHFGTRSDRASDNCPNILEARQMSFRYAVFGMNFVEGTFPVDAEHSSFSSGIAERGGNDFMITLGMFDEAGYTKLGGTKNLATATRNVAAGTVMHELGHTLGLAHGGNQEENGKPNYLSVMNYDLQFLSLDVNRPLDYSREALPDLDEHSLDESKGVSGPAGRTTIYHGRQFREDGLHVLTLSAPADGALDWSLDESLTPGRISADINDDGNLGALKGFDDWAHIDFNFRANSQYANGARNNEVDDLQTTAQFVAAAESIDFDEDGKSNAADNCPGVANADQADANGNGVGDVCEPATGTVDLRVESAGESMLTDDGPIIAVKFYVTNTGTLPATSLTIALPPVADTTYLSAESPPGVTCEANDGTITCSGYAVLASGATVSGLLIFKPDHVGTYSHEVRATTTANDADATDNQLASATEVTRNTFGLGWQNEANSLDVDADGIVAPIDALLIINELNRPAYSGPSGKLPLPPVSGVVHFFDVDGNGFAVPLDALLVINFLNAGPGPEGEGPSLTTVDVGLAFPFVDGNIAHGSSNIAALTPVGKSSEMQPAESQLNATPMSLVAVSRDKSENPNSSQKSTCADNEPNPALADWLFAHGL